MTEPAPETPQPGDAEAPAPKRFLFLRKKESALAPAADGEAPAAPPADPVAQGVPAPDARVRAGVLRRRRRQLLGAYEQAIFDLGGLAMELHSRRLLAEDVLRRRAAVVADLRGQIDELDGRLDEMKMARQERRQAGRGSTITCPNCGARAQAGANFCASCGTPLQGVPPQDDLAAAEADQPTEVVMEEQVTSVIIEAPEDAGHTQVIPPASEGDA